MPLFDPQLVPTQARALRESLSDAQHSVLGSYLQALFVDVALREAHHQVGYRQALKEIHQHLLEEETDDGFTG